MLSNTADSAIQSEESTPLLRPKRLTVSVVCATLTVCLGALAFGFVLGYPSPVQEALRQKKHWNDTQLSWFNGIAPLGAMLGVLLGLYTVDKYGRKFNIMVASLPLVVGWALVASAELNVLFFVGRCFTGVGAGMSSLAVPVYIAEVAPAKYRGFLGSLNQLSITFGQLMAFCLGVGLNWHWLAILAALPSAAMALLLMWFPETPRWLIKNGRFRNACDVLVFLRKTSYAECEEECKEIQYSLVDEDPVSLKEFKKPTIYRPLIIAVMLMVFQQLSGINAVLTYASVMLGEAGISDANVPAISVAVVQFIFTGISCVIVDKLGRRPLLLFSTALMCVSMIVLGLSSYMDGFPSAVTLVFLCVFLVGFSLGMGPIPWLVMSEIFPARVRGVASGIATEVNWLGTFIVIKFYVNMKAAMHEYGCFWFYAGMCLLCFVYVSIFLPETKGKTLEEVEALFGDRHDYREAENGRRR